MAKIGIEATKYVIKAKLTATGVVEKPDVIGAVFGQTEGLLGEELDLRELQKSGRIGRIEVTVETKEGKSEGLIEIPTSLSKEDTALIAASLETIERIGPCNAKIEILSVDDVRSTKRDYVIERAKALLGDLQKVTPESQEMAEMVKEQTRVGEVTEIGPDKMPVGPNFQTSEEVILVEGRADVINLAKHGIGNVIGVGGTLIPASLKDLCANKKLTVFLDGDRGGDLILKKLLHLVDIDFVARAPIGREVEELTSKEIIKALRLKVSKEEALKSFEAEPQPIESSFHRRGGRDMHRGRSFSRGSYRDAPMREEGRTTTLQYREEFEQFTQIADGLMGSGQIAILKQDGTEYKEIGRIPKSDAADVLKNLPEGKARALVVDGDADQSLINDAATKGITYVVVGRKPRYLRRKQGMYVLEAHYLKQVIQENKSPSGGTEK